MIDHIQKDMLQFLENLPPNLIGIEISGILIKDDYRAEVLPNIDKFKNKEGNLNYIIVLKANIVDFTSAVWLNDLILVFKQFSNAPKIAIVTDQKLPKDFTDLFDSAFQNNPRSFKSDQYVDAVFWASAQK